MPPPSSSPPQPSPTTPLPPIGTGTRWSDPATWGGTVPPAGATVVIPAGRTIVLDTILPPLNGITIEGTLAASPDHDIGITANYVFVRGGRLQIGSAQQPYLRNATITLTGSSAAENPATAGFGNKVLAVMGGTLELHGRPVTRSWTKLNASVGAGARTLTLAESPGWRVGDQVVITPSTGNMNQNEYSVATIEAINGATLVLREPTRFPHIGQRHTVGDVTFDFRSEVGLLTHNIVIQGDAASTTSRVGGHSMFMSGANGATVQIANAQFQRMGQLNQLGRYPIHFHVMGAGCRNCYVQNATVRDTIQRGIVVHDTSSVRVAGNVVFNTVGHNIVVETAFTGGNLIEGNLALLNSMPSPDHTEPTLVSQNDHLPGNFWMKSAQNSFVGNVAAGSLSNGFIFDAVRNGPVTFRANVGRNAMAQGRVGDFNFGSGILLMFNRNADPGDDWSDNVVFHNLQGFWPENEPDDDSAPGTPITTSFTVRRLVAAENAINMVNRGVGMKVTYIDPVIGGSITGRPAGGPAFHNQYGSEITVVNPTLVNLPQITSATDIATPPQSRFIVSGGRRVGNTGSYIDDTSINTFLDDVLMPRGTYVAADQPSLATSDCVRVVLGDGFLRCPTNRVVGELVVYDGNTSVNRTRTLNRSDGLSYRTVERPGANAQNGLHGYAVLVNHGLTYALPTPAASGYALRLDMGHETFLDRLPGSDAASVDVAIPVNGAPRAVHRTGTSPTPDAPGANTALRAAASSADWNANPATTYLYDAANARIWVKATARWIVVQQ
jgi:hypothetical protein